MRPGKINFTNLRELLQPKEIVGVFDIANRVQVTEEEEAKGLVVIEQEEKGSAETTLSISSDLIGLKLRLDNWNVIDKVDRNSIEKLTKDSLAEIVKFLKSKDIDEYHTKHFSEGGVFWEYLLENVEGETFPYFMKILINYIGFLSKCPKEEIEFNLRVFPCGESSFACLEGTRERLEIPFKKLAGVSLKPEDQLIIECHDAVIQKYLGKYNRFISPGNSIHALDAIKYLAVGVANPKSNFTISTSQEIPAFAVLEIYNNYIKDLNKELLDRYWGKILNVSLALQDCLKPYVDGFGDTEGTRKRSRKERVDGPRKRLKKEDTEADDEDMDDSRESRICFVEDIPREISTKLNEFGFLFHDFIDSEEAEEDGEGYKYYFKTGKAFEDAIKKSLAHLHIEIDPAIKVTSISAGAGAGEGGHFIADNCHSDIFSQEIITDIARLLDSTNCYDKRKAINIILLIGDRVVKGSSHAVFSKIIKQIYETKINKSTEIEKLFARLQALEPKHEDTVSTMGQLIKEQGNCELDMVAAFLKEQIKEVFYDDESEYKLLKVDKVIGDAKTGIVIRAMNKEIATKHVEIIKLLCSNPDHQTIDDLLRKDLSSLDRSIVLSWCGQYIENLIYHPRSVVILDFLYRDTIKELRELEINSNVIYNVALCAARSDRMDVMDFVRTLTKDSEELLAIMTSDNNCSVAKYLLLNNFGYFKTMFPSSERPRDEKMVYVELLTKDSDFSFGYINKLLLSIACDPLMDNSKFSFLLNYTFGHGIDFSIKYFFAYLKNSIMPPGYGNHEIFLYLVNCGDNNDMLKKAFVVVKDSLIYNHKNENSSSIEIVKWNPFLLTAEHDKLDYFETLVNVCGIDFQSAYPVSHDVVFATPLYIAAAEGDLKKIKFLLKKGVDIKGLVTSANIQDSVAVGDMRHAGYSIFFAAAQNHRHSDILPFLLDKFVSEGGDINSDLIKSSVTDLIETNSPFKEGEESKCERVKKALLCFADNGLDIDFIISCLILPGVGNSILVSQEFIDKSLEIAGSSCMDEGDQKISISEKAYQILRVAMENHNLAVVKYIAEKGVLAILSDGKNVFEIFYESIARGEERTDFNKKKDEEISEYLLTKFGRLAPSPQLSATLGAGVGAGVRLHKE